MNTPRHTELRVVPASAAADSTSTTLRIDAGRPQVRLGWPMRPADEKIRERAAIRPFEGFHRATPPKLFGEPKN